MGVDGGVSGSSDQIEAFFVRDMVHGLRVSVLSGQVEVQEVADITLIVDPHREVVWFDVSVDEVPSVEVL